MENCFTKNPDINVVYTINEPAASGLRRPSGRFARGRAHRLRRRRVRRASDHQKGVIDATSQQYPVKIAELGVEAIKAIAEGGEKPKTPRASTSSTPVALSPTSRPRASVPSTLRGRGPLLGLTPQT